MLARIQTLEPKLHSYITVMGEQALEQAAAADAMREQGKTLGSLHGVPIAVKDLCHKIGAPTTGGHSFRKNIQSDTDATVVARLEAAGAVMLGKLATTEGAMVGYHRDFEVPRNPWADLDRWPGVSSGGSGVATAAGLCFASLGTDTGGSIRYPSAVNGIVGLKPTWGRVSRHGVLDLGPTLDHVGPMTRSVRDAARVLGVIAGHDANDPTSLVDAVPDYEAEMTRGVRGLRIGWDDTFATKDVEPYVASAVRTAVTGLANLGAAIVEVEVPALTDEEDAAWSILAGAEAAAVHESTFPSRADEYGNYFREFLRGGRDTSSVDLAKAIFARKSASGKVAPVFQGIDLLLCPTLASESYRYNSEDAYGGIDLERGTIAGASLEFFARSARFVSRWDYNGYPTLSVPCGFSPDGIPISLQFIGAPLAEAALCRAGFAYEQSQEFHLQHPQVG
ncbi:MAG: Asp-tRNA(Asn)/Glu-tRNA(Gln) amidotransferase GatCAB subunit A [Pseudomonadales bacterium]|nr:Asp-tRNA(Asn)/Glu-tRNA(Gln) amidotransferase GatCAB subunit A [Pseudomonadales bacterium]